jgi:peptide/nickel transport system substrate-binding protein
VIRELRFVPVPNANRVEGALAGHDFADLLPTEALARWKNPAARPFRCSRLPSASPIWCSTPRKACWPTSPAPGAANRAGRGRDAGRRLWRHALFHGRGQPLSQGLAVLLDGRHRPVQPAQCPQGQGLAAKAGYKGEPVRILTSRQYDFHYNMALLMAEQLKRAGFKPS